jgi:Methyltransferase FkbM domain
MWEMEEQAMIRPLVRGLKEVLPKGKRYRKITRGLARGGVMAVDFRSDLRAYLGVFEYELTPHFRRMLKSGSTGFDIGGQGGYHALMMAKTSGARVAAFECEHVSAEEMRKVFAQNPDLSIDVVEAYVGAENGNGLITIDKAAHELFVPDVIKIDIEGAEDAALEGATETLANHRPSLIIEVHGAEKEAKCITLLRSFNYTIRVVDQGWVLKDHARAGYNRWLAAYSA